MATLKIFDTLFISRQSDRRRLSLVFSLPVTFSLELITIPLLPSVQFPYFCSSEGSYCFPASVHIPPSRLALDATFLGHS